MKTIKNVLPKAAMIFLIFTLLCGVVYTGVVTGIAQGDFLRHLLVCQTTDLKMQEGYRLGSIVRRDFCPALQIDADFGQAVTSILNQNFVPIVDGRNVLCGILTRKRLIEFLAQTHDKKE